MAADGPKASFGGDKSALEIDRGNGRTAVCIYRKSFDYTISKDGFYSM